MGRAVCATAVMRGPALLAAVAPLATTHKTIARLVRAVTTRTLPVSKRARLERTAPAGVQRREIATPRVAASAMVDGRGQPAILALPSSTRRWTALRARRATSITRSAIPHVPQRIATTMELRTGIASTGALVSAATDGTGPIASYVRRGSIP